MLILRKSRLSAAFPTSAIVFIGVMFSSWLVLGEALTWTMVFGAVLIVAGILLLGNEAEEVQFHGLEDGPRDA
jgi:drug/metabolite transporter (DMT)-like permease